MSLTQSEIYSLALGAGLTSDRAKVAAAIAMAESDGDPNAHNLNPKTGDDSWGLWQINLYKSLGPARRKTFKLAANGSQDILLTNPTLNAASMYHISGGGLNFLPWSTYKHGAYKKFLNNPVKDERSNHSTGFWKNFLDPNLPGWLGGKNVSGTVASAPGVSTIKDTATAVSNISDKVDAGAHWLSDSANWVRIGYVLGGAVLVVLGIQAVVKSTQAGQTAIGAAKSTALTVAKVAA